MLVHMSNPTFEMVQWASLAELSSVPYDRITAAMKARAIASALYSALNLGVNESTPHRIASACESALVLCREIARSQDEPIDPQEDVVRDAYYRCKVGETASADELLRCLDDFARRTDGLPDLDDVLNLGMVACLVRRGLPL